MLDGKKLIELPEKKIDITALHFSQEEADIYKMVRPSVPLPPYAPECLVQVEARSQDTFNRYLRAGTVLK